MYMLIRLDELAQTEEELRELERLCWEAKLRYRDILKKRLQQSLRLLLRQEYKNRLKY